jgi:hypothetical protein
MSVSDGDHLTSALACRNRRRYISPTNSREPFYRRLDPNYLPRYDDKMRTVHEKADDAIYNAVSLPSRNNRAGGAGLTHFLGHSDTLGS